MSNSLTFKSSHWRDKRLLTNNEKIMRMASIGGILAKRSQALLAISVHLRSCNLLISLARNLLRISDSVPLPLFVSDHWVSLGFMFLPAAASRCLCSSICLRGPMSMTPFLWNSVTSSCVAFRTKAGSSHPPLTSSPEGFHLLCDVRLLRLFRRFPTSPASANSRLKAFRTLRTRGMGYGIASGTSGL